VTAEISTKPYLMRAIYEWCVDCGHTPYLSVTVTDACRVPMEYVKNNELVLNISPSATRNLKIENDRLHFSARFNGVSREVSVPIGAVSGIFARENSEGLMFKVEAEEAPSLRSVPESTEAEITKTAVAARERNHLKVVK
jgi:stringent starvation protein B